MCGGIFLAHQETSKCCKCGKEAYITLRIEDNITEDGKINGHYSYFECSECGARSKKEPYILKYR